MSTFNSSDVAAFKGGVWVFCEQRQGSMMPTSFELISEGRKLADELDTKLYGILLGDGIEGIAKELGGYGADGVYVCDHPMLKDYTTDGYTKVICDVIEEYKPEIMLIGATNIGRDLGPRCAARLHTGLCADCTHLDVDMGIYKDFLKENSTLAPERIDATSHAMVLGEKHDVSRDLKMTRPAFGGHLMASIICPRFRPAMATVTPCFMTFPASNESAKADTLSRMRRNRPRSSARSANSTSSSEKSSSNSRSEVMCSNSSRNARNSSEYPPRICVAAMACEARESEAIMSATASACERSIRLFMNARRVNSPASAARAPCDTSSESMRPTT